MLRAAVTGLEKRSPLKGEDPFKPGELRTRLLLADAHHEGNNMGCCIRDAEDQQGGVMARLSPMLQELPASFFRARKESHDIITRLAILLGFHPPSPPRLGV